MLPPIKSFIRTTKQVAIVSADFGRSERRPNTKMTARSPGHPSTNIIRRFLLWSLFVIGAETFHRPVSRTRGHTLHCRTKFHTVSRSFTAHTTTGLLAVPEKPNDDESKDVLVDAANAQMPTKGGREEEEGKEDEHDERDLVSWEEMDWETAQRERQQSNRMWFRFWAPYEISRYVTTALWVFVIVGYVLNIMGYAYVWDANGQLTIDTMAQRDFQAELAKGLRETSRNIVSP